MIIIKCKYCGEVIKSGVTLKIDITCTYCPYCLSELRDVSSVKIIQKQ